MQKLAKLSQLTQINHKTPELIFTILIGENHTMWCDGGTPAYIYIYIVHRNSQESTFASAMTI